jgi:hypothetical protein
MLCLAMSLLRAVESTEHTSCNASLIDNWSVGSTLAAPMIQVAAVDQCCAACATNPSCLNFVFHGKNCFLKADSNNSHAKPGNLAGFVRSTAPPTPSVPTSPPTPSPTVPQEASFADSYTDHMVLQQLPSPTVLWGFGPPTSTVMIERLAGDHGTLATNTSTIVGADSIWRVQMSGRQAGNESFVFRVAGTAISITDVVYGGTL